MSRGLGRVQRQVIGLLRQLEEYKGYKMPLRLLRCKVDADRSNVNAPSAPSSAGE